MRLLILLLAFASVGLIFVSIYLLYFSDKEVLSSRLKQLRATIRTSVGEENYKPSFYERIINPLYTQFVEFLNKMTPVSVIERYQTLIYYAGMSKRLKPTNILAAQILAGGAVGLLIGFVLSIGRSSNVLLILIAALIGFYLPYSLLVTNGQKRQKIIQHLLPDFIDLLYISVEAGLGFYMALTRITAKRDDVLSAEIKWMLDDIAKGRERYDAMKDAVKRTGVDDFNSFITAIIQSEQLGTNVTNILKIQSKMMRMKRRQRSEEAAQKLPVKLIFPVIFFLFPAIYIIVLGPAVLNAMANFKGMFF